MSNSPFQTTAVIPDHINPSPPEVPEGRDNSAPTANVVKPAVMADEPPLDSALAALLIPIVICVVLGALVWWQLLNDFSHSP